jgi:hypothetical protein
MQNENEKVKIIAVSILSIGAVIIALKLFAGGSKLVNSILEGLGISDDETDTGIKKAEEKADKLGYFNPAFIKNSPAGTILLTKKNADVKVRNLWDSVTLTWDYPEKMKAVFSNIITKSQVAHLAKVFKDTHNVDLLAWLVEKFDTDKQQKTLTQVIDRLNTLPDFRSDKATSKTPIVTLPLAQKKQNSLADFMKANQQKADANKPVFKVPPFNPKSFNNG